MRKGKRVRADQMPIGAHFRWWGSLFPEFDYVKVLPDAYTSEEHAEAVKDALTRYPDPDKFDYEALLSERGERNGDAFALTQITKFRGKGADYYMRVPHG